MSKRKAILQYLAAGATLSCLACSAPEGVVSGANPGGENHSRPPYRQVKIRQVAASEEGILVNAYLVEGASGVVCVDSALTVSDAQALRQQVAATGKPLLAVVLTHGHPDHYNGVHALLDGRADVPVYATPEVDQVIRESDAAKGAQWKPIFGEQWPAERSFPSHLLKDGQSVRIDGNTWTVHALGPGESHADSYWELSARRRYVFLGDVVMHDVHAYTSDGHTQAWLETLADLRPRLRRAAKLYPGHGAPGGIELLEVQSRYLRTYRSRVDALRRGGSALSDGDKAELTQQMKQLYPDHALDFLIGLGADAVAQELANENADAE